MGSSPSKFLSAQSPAVGPTWNEVLADATSEDGGGIIAVQGGPRPGARCPYRRQEGHGHRARPPKDSGGDRSDAAPGPGRLEPRGGGGGTQALGEAGGPSPQPQGGAQPCPHRTSASGLQDKSHVSVLKPRVWARWAAQPPAETSGWEGVGAGSESQPSAPPPPVTAPFRSLGTGAPGAWRLFRGVGTSVAAAT